MTYLIAIMTITHIHVVSLPQVTSRVFALTCTFPMLGNTSSGPLRASSYGVAQALVALTRACGPTYGGSLFAWSETNGHGWPFDFHLTFYICAATALGSMFLSTFLPESVNLKLVEKEDDCDDDTTINDNGNGNDEDNHGVFDEEDDDDDDDNDNQELQALQSQSHSQSKRRQETV